jgi:hypothetical protein
MKDRLCPGTTSYSQSIRVPRCQRWTLNAYQKNALCVLVGIAHFCKFTTICIRCQDGEGYPAFSIFFTRLGTVTGQKFAKIAPRTSEKPSSANGTWGETPWESRSSPVKDYQRGGK